MAYQPVCQNPEDLALRRDLHLGTDQPRRSSGSLPGNAVALCAMLSKELQTRRWRLDRSQEDCASHGLLPERGLTAADAKRAS
jgi:hypothetical protein